MKDSLPSGVLGVAGEKLASAAIVTGGTTGAMTFFKVINPCVGLCASSAALILTLVLIRNQLTNRKILLKQLAELEKDIKEP